MSYRAATNPESGYAEELSNLLKRTFQNILQDSQKVIESISSKDPITAKLLEVQAQKIGSIEGKLENILQLQSLEHDEFGHTRKPVNVCDDIAQIASILQKKTSQKKTIIETKFPRNKPLVRLNKSLFQKWILWFINRLYIEKSVIHVLINVAHYDNKVVIRLSPKRLSGKLEMAWKGIDWLCLVWYFELENGYIEQLKESGIEITLPAVVQYIPQISEKNDEEQINILQKISEGVDLPTLSPIAVKIIKLASDEDASAKDIANVITLDPALTARLLKVVNSPFYGFANRITSISQAITILGMKAVRTLSLCISMLETFPANGDTDFGYHDFWQRSFAAAVTCKLTAQKLGLRLEEEAFIAGLTQNIGYLVFVRYYPTRYSRLLKRHYQSSIDLCEMEHQAWGIDHAKLGYEIFSQWKMPLILGQSILYHHSTEEIPEKKTNLRKLATLVYLSDIAAHVLYDDNKGQHLQRLKAEYKNLLNMNDDDIDDIMENVAQETEKVAREFNFSVDKPADYAQILQNANIELGRINLDYEQMTRELMRQKKRAEKLAKELQEANALLAEEVNTDGLTKLYNHRFFFEVITKEFANSRRHNLPLSCIMLDIDFFKKINDTYGHQEGDIVLASIGRILSEEIREGDYAARYGGEEFTLILPNTIEKDALMVAERIRTTVENTKISKKIEKGIVTISVGVASLVNNNVDKAIGLVELADKAVYMAKKSGRNRVIASSLISLHN